MLSEAFKVCIIGFSHSSIEFLESFCNITNVPHTYSKTLKLSTLETEIHITARELFLDDPHPVDFKDLHQHFQWAEAFIFIYYVSDSENFGKIKSWRDCIIQLKDKQKIPMQLVGRTDVENRLIPYDSGRQLAKSIECAFFETTAKDTVHTQEIFEAAVNSINDRRKIASQTSPASNFTRKRGSMNNLVPIIAALKKMNGMEEIKEEPLVSNIPPPPPLPPLEPLANPINANSNNVATKLPKLNLNPKLRDNVSFSAMASPRQINGLIQTLREKLTNLFAEDEINSPSKKRREFKFISASST